MWLIDISQLVIAHLFMYISSFSLLKLVLSHNAMTDTGLQKMTTPHRMLRKGPEHIQYIDLTGKWYDISYVMKVI